MKGWVIVIVYIVVGLKIFSDFYDQLKWGKWGFIARRPFLSFLVIMLVWPFFLYVYIFINITQNFGRALVLTILGIPYEIIKCILNVVCLPFFLIYTFILFLQDRKCSKKDKDLFV